MGYELTIRIGAEVKHLQAETLDQALELLKKQLGPLTTQSSRKPVGLGYRTYEPAQQVAARGELRINKKRFRSTYAGVDVRGDGSSEAWIGHFGRKLIDQEAGESSFDALSRRVKTVEASRT